MKFIKWLLIISMVYTIFYSIKPVDNDYSFFAGLVMGTIGEYYWLEKVIKGGKDE